MLLVDQTLKLVFAAFRPGDGSFDGELLRLKRSIDMCTLVETDHHISAIADLQLNGFFGCKMKLALGPFWLEGNALIVQIAKLSILLNERIRLEAARVRHNRSLPRAHLVQAAQRLDRRRTWALH